MTYKIKPFIFLILSGWGIAPPSSANAISLAKTPNFDRLATHYKTMSLRSAGNDVGLLDGEPGSIKAGYLNIGAGRIVYEILPKINVSIKDRSFFDNPAFIAAMDNCLKNNSALHLMGQVSERNEHSSLKHLFALIDLARSKGLGQIYLHLFLDGTQTDHKNGISQIAKVQERLETIEIAKIATIHGQYYAMNRDGAWDKTAKSYRAIVEGESEISGEKLEELIEQSYANEIYDDELVPIVQTKNNKPIAKIAKHDSIIGFNFKADRMRQLARAFVDPNFDKFALKKNYELEFVGMIRYCPEYEMKFAFEKDEIKTSLLKVLNDKHLEQLYVAEADRCIQLVNFLNGNLDQNFTNFEELTLPENKIAKAVVRNILDEKSDFIVVNFAMAEQSAVEGNLQKTISSIEKIDNFLGKIVDAALGKDGIVLITSEHSNIEEFSDLQNGLMKKENSTNPVPMILVGNRWGQDRELGEGKIDLSLLKNVGVLADVAPTILKILEIKKPKEMTGKSLI